MDTIEVFPHEIFELISYNLDPLTLSVSKSLHNMYNDNWYYNLLKLKYPNLNLYTKTDHKDLYKLSLLQGDIYFIEGILNNSSSDSDIKPVSVNIEGVKSKYMTIFYTNNTLNHETNMQYHFVLTFNGDCYITDGISKMFVDNSVTNISQDYYIKHNKIFKIINDDDTLSSVLILEHIDIINNIESDYDYYFTTDYSCCKILYDNTVLERRFTNKILKMGVFNCMVLLLFEDRTLIAVDNDLKFDLIVQYNVDDLFGRAYTFNGKIYTFIRYCEDKIKNRWRYRCKKFRVNYDIISNNGGFYNCVCKNNILSFLNMDNKNFTINLQYLQKIKNIVGTNASSLYVIC